MAQGGAESNHDSVALKHEFLKESVARIEQDYKERLARFEREYVAKAEFDPVKNLVYGLVSLILIGVVTGILALIMRSPS